MSDEEQQPEEPGFDERMAMAMNRMFQEQLPAFDQRMARIVDKRLEQHAQQASKAQEAAQAQNASVNAQLEDVVQAGNHAPQDSAPASTGKAVVNSLLEDPLGTGKQLMEMWFTLKNGANPIAQFQQMYKEQPELVTFMAQSIMPPAPWEPESQARQANTIWNEAWRQAHRTRPESMAQSLEALGWRVQSPTSTPGNMPSPPSEPGASTSAAPMSAPGAGNAKPSAAPERKARLSDLATRL